MERLNSFACILEPVFDLVLDDVFDIFPPFSSSLLDLVSGGLSRVEGLSLVGQDSSNLEDVSLGLGVSLVGNSLASKVFVFCIKAFPSGVSSSLLMFSLSSS